MRALPMATPTNTRCPSDTTPLIGLSQNQLQVALGKPEFISESGRIWTYFFTSPVPLSPARKLDPGILRGLRAN